MEINRITLLVINPKSIKESIFINDHQKKERIITLYNIITKFLSKNKPVNLYSFTKYNFNKKI